MTKSKKTDSREWESTKGKKLKKHAHSTLQSQLLWFRLPDSTQIFKELSAVPHAYPSLSLFLTPMLYVAFTTTVQKELIVSRYTVLSIVVLQGSQMSNQQTSKTSYTGKILVIMISNLWSRLWTIRNENSSFWTSSWFATLKWPRLWSEKIEVMHMVLQMITECTKNTKSPKKSFGDQELMGWNSPCWSSSFRVTNLWWLVWQAPPQ